MSEDRRSPVGSDTPEVLREGREEPEAEHQPDEHVAHQRVRAEQPRASATNTAAVASG